MAFFKRSTPSTIEVAEQHQSQELERVQPAGTAGTAGTEGTELEARSLTNWGGGLTGYNIIDPLAIPPFSGTGISRNWAGVTINERTLFQADACMVCLRTITNSMMELGNAMAYTEKLADDNWPYREWLANQPSVLTNTFGMAPTGNIETPQYIGIERTVASMMFWGEAIWYVVERGREGPSAVEVLNPSLFEARREDRGELTYWYGVGSERVQLNASNILHIPHKILPAAMRGMSAYDYIGLPAAISLAATQYGANWFNSGIHPGWILTHPGKLGREEVERIVQTMAIQHGGLSQAHSPLLIDSGVKPEKAGSTPNENQYLETLEYSRHVIAAYFGVPSSALGNSLQRETPAPAHTVGEDMQRFLTWTLSGYINPLEQIYTSMLPSSVKVAYDRNRVLQSDTQSFAALILNLRQTNRVSINEVRTRYLGLAPVEGGDEVIAPLASNTSPEQTKPMEPMEPAAPSKPESPTGE